MCKYFVALDNLNANRARVAVLDAEIPKLERLMNKLTNDVSIPTAIYGDDTAAIHATGSHGDPTQRRALKDMPADVRQLWEDIRAMTIERHRTAAWVELADKALAFLGERERFVVRCRAVEHMGWTDIVDELCEEYGELRTERTLRHIYQRACEKIKPFFMTETLDGTQAPQIFTERRIYGRASVMPA